MALDAGRGQRARRELGLDARARDEGDAEAGSDRALHGLLQPQLEPDVEVAEAHGAAAQLVLDHLPHARAFLHQDQVLATELVERYHPQLIWFDWWIEQPVFQPYLQKFTAFYYNQGAQWKKGVVINYKNKTFPDTAAVLDIERGQLSGIRPLFWQTDTSVSKNSWGYVGNQDYKSVDSIVDDLVDIVSKNGALLLNIGPKPDGERHQAGRGT